MLDVKFVTEHTHTHGGQPPVLFRIKFILRN